MSSILPLTVILFSRNQDVRMNCIKKLVLSTFLLFCKGDVCFSSTINFILYFNICLIFYLLISFHNGKIKTLYMLIKFKSPSFVFMRQLSSISIALKLCTTAQSSELQLLLRHTYALLVVFLLFLIYKQTVFLHSFDDTTFPYAADQQG